MKKTQTTTAYLWIALCFLLLASVPLSGLWVSSASSPQAGGAPPGFQISENAANRPPLPPQAVANLAELEQRLASLPGGKEQIEQVRKGQGVPAPASRQGPPDLAEVLQHAQIPQLPPQAQSNLQQLTTRLGNLPGGKAQIDEANRGRRPSSSLWYEFQDRLERINPFLSAHAFGIYKKIFQKVKLPDERFDMQDLKSTEKVFFRGAWEDRYSKKRGISYFKNKRTVLSNGIMAKKNKIMRINVPRTNWYLVNKKAYTPAGLGNIRKKALARWDGAQYAVKQMFDAVEGWADYPRWEYLAQGTHHFNYADPETNPGHDWSSEMSVMEYNGPFVKKYRRLPKTDGSDEYDMGDADGEAYFDGVQEYDGSPKAASSFSGNDVDVLDDGTVAEARIIKKVRVPQPGWYMTNIKMWNYSSTATVVTSKWEPTLGKYKVRSKFPASPNAWNDYPTLQYLNAGDNYIHWTVPKGHDYWVHSTTVESFGF